MSIIKRDHKIYIKKNQGRMQGLGVCKACVYGQE